MKKRYKVFKVKNIPTRPPITFTLLVYLVMKDLNVKDIVWGIVGTLVFFLWVFAINRQAREEEIDLFDDGKQETPGL